MKSTVTAPAILCNTTHAVEGYRITDDSVLYSCSGNLVCFGNFVWKCFKCLSVLMKMLTFCCWFCCCFCCCWLKGNCFVVASAGCAPRVLLWHLQSGRLHNWPVAQQAANCDAAHRKAHPQNKRLVPPTKDNNIGICKFMAAYTQVGRMAQHRPQREIKFQV